MPPCCLDTHVVSCNECASLTTATDAPLIVCLERSRVSDHDSLPRAIARTGWLTLYLLHELRNAEHYLSADSAQVVNIKYGMKNACSRGQHLA